MQLAVANAALAHGVVRQRLDRLDRPAQHRDLEAGLVVEMNMQCRHLEIVVAVLRLGEPPAEIARLVVVDIGQGGDAEAVALVRRRRLQPLARLRLAQDSRSASERLA